jgi:chromosome partitioning protein
MPERVIACIGAKGGVGKSTIAIALSVCAADCLLIDTDPQLSSGNWYREREAGLPELVRARAGEVAKAVGATKRRVVIIDTPPHAAEAIQAVAALADQLLIIVQPSILDLRAISLSVDIAKAAQKSAVVILNRCPPVRGTAEASIVTEARRALSVYQLPVCPVAITQRAAMSYALVGGLSITEYEPEGKAADEIRRLWSYLCRSDLSWT